MAKHKSLEPLKKTRRYSRVSVWHSDHRVQQTFVCRCTSYDVWTADSKRLEHCPMTRLLTLTQVDSH